jgi:hypothetical protein
MAGQLALTQRRHGRPIVVAVLSAVLAFGVVILAGCSGESDDTNATQPQGTYSAPATAGATAGSTPTPEDTPTVIDVTPTTEQDDADPFADDPCNGKVFDFYGLPDEKAANSCLVNYYETIYGIVTYGFEEDIEFKDKYTEFTILVGGLPVATYRLRYIDNAMVRVS